uniref:Uncharacterized protein n=1 Tax=Ascaris lumbricoides TaxID=6252 RepID=A0A0M3HQ61_ASCLU
MGHCASRDQKDQKKLNRRIDEQIRKDQSMSLRIIKLLLLERIMPTRVIEFTCVVGHV